MSLSGRQPNFAWCLAVSGLLHYVYIFGSSCSLMEFCHMQNSLCVHLRTIAQVCWAVSSQLTQVWTIGKKQYVLQMSSQYGELRPTSGWDLLASLVHPSTFQRVSRLGSITAWHSSSGLQPNFEALNRGRHLYSAGRPSRWALAHILVVISFISARVTACSTVVMYAATEDHVSVLTVKWNLK